MRQQSAIAVILLVCNYLALVISADMLLPKTVIKVIHDVCKLNREQFTLPGVFTGTFQGAFMSCSVVHTHAELCSLHICYACMPDAHA